MKFDIEQIINEYSAMVYRIALVYGKTKEDAEDIFQEVFLRLVRYQNRLESKEHVRNWLIRVTVNYGKSYIKKQSRNQTLPLMEDVMLSEGEQDNAMGYAVYQAVKSLPEKYRVVVHLYYYEELSVKEISACLQRREGTVKSQLARGRDLLKKKLGKEFGDEREL